MEHVREQCRLNLGMQQQHSPSPGGEELILPLDSWKARQAWSSGGQTRSSATAIFVPSPSLHYCTPKTFKIQIVKSQLSFYNIPYSLSF